MDVKQEKQIPIPYLTLPTTELLEKFGEGSHVPGSGSAAALSGILAVSLMQTVCKLTLKRKEIKYRDKRLVFDRILQELDGNYKPKLITFFKDDIAVFEEVSKLRIERDKASDKKEKQRLVKAANDQLKEATIIPIEIGKTCLRLLNQYAFIVFDDGFQSARGDSGVAISNLLSAISGSLFVAFINLRTAKSNKWAEQLRREINLEDYNKAHNEGIKRLISLYEPVIAPDPNQPEIPF